MKKGFWQLQESFKLQGVPLPRVVLLSVVGNDFSNPLSRQRHGWCWIFWISYELSVGSLLLAKSVAYTTVYTPQSKAISCCCTGLEIILSAVLLQFRIRHICFITTSLTSNLWFVWIKVGMCRHLMIIIVNNLYKSIFLYKELLQFSKGYVFKPFSGWKLFV